MAPPPDGLRLAHGLASAIGARADNQDYVACVIPEPAELARYGALAVVADGLGGLAGGRVAAEVATRAFVEGYYQLPATLDVARRASRALDSANRWIHDIGRRDPALDRMGCAFSALALRGRQAQIFHVGDARVYRLRGAGLACLTQDHALSRPGYEHVLYRAVGLESSLKIEHRTLALEPHDRFLLCSDGLHGVLGAAQLSRCLAERAAPGHTAARLIELALARGAHDNLTALVVDVVELPRKAREELLLSLRDLPLASPPDVGQRVDGFVLTRVIAAGRCSVLYQAQAPDRPQPLVVKWPLPTAASDAEYREAFAREAWIGASVKSPWLAEFIEPEPGRQSCLYALMPYYPGPTLEAWMRHHRPVPLAAGLALALRLCRAVYALHRQGVVHRDIKPDNVLLPDAGGLRLLDLGIARLPAWPEDSDLPVPGTPSYMAPELFRGERGSRASDVFSLGVTLYRLFAAGAYPYGEIEAFSQPRFGQIRPLTQLRPDLPVWLEVALNRALASDPERRHADAMELAHELEAGLANGRPVQRPARLPLYSRNPLLFWQCLSAGLLLALLAALQRLAALSH